MIIKLYIYKSTFEKSSEDCLLNGVPYTLETDKMEIAANRDSNDEFILIGIRTCE